MMTRDQVEDFFISLGWYKDIYGNYVGTRTVIKRGCPPVTRMLRVKLGAYGCTIQLRTIERNRLKEFRWNRLTSSMYKDIFVLQDGRVRIGSEFFEPLSEENAA